MYDYAFVHIYYTLPLAALLTTISYPFLTRRHYYQTAILIAIAVAATIPWDSYLIRHAVWTYPDEVVLGFTLWDIPLEELFFFVVQAYVTSLLYLLMNKPLLHAEYLISERPRWTKTVYGGVLAVLSALLLMGALLLQKGGEGTYLGLILVWAAPFALLTWSLGGKFMVQLPLTSTLLPILAPTIYLWIVDELALGRGTWSIESGTKLGFCLFGSLEIEEAVFFLATNTLIVFGLGAFDNALAIIDIFPDAFRNANVECPAPAPLLRALLMEQSRERLSRVKGLQDAVKRLQRKSRSFYLASSAFSGRLRVDLVLLYSYCRVADDLIDEPPADTDTQAWITKLRQHLNLAYDPHISAGVVRSFIEINFPPEYQSALKLLPTHILPQEPLLKLLDGFHTDARFAKIPMTDPTAASQAPIATDKDLELYASQVAGTVGALCVSLIAHHHPFTAHKTAVLGAAERMGIALQYINIARDVATDALIHRIYLPTSWLQEVAGGEFSDFASPAAVIKDPYSSLVEKLRDRLLSKAFAIYQEARPAMEYLPDEARRPMVVAVESYMEIGRVLTEREKGVKVERGKATVPRVRRLRVVLKALTNR